ncbi:PP2C family protein-serine/threonine phosphatase [Mycetocola saprophilus]|uniref:PP2C family protein-serine/threonine phosphatase n=1 Tax=Mycetocola saprophilus TaxID=76636 RepID=UPI0009DEBCD7|nr:protein phosphatase 2C domain-containing protein [Mycetocola saprophilus]
MSELDVHSGSYRVPRSEGADLIIRWASATDTGRKREVNQDALIARFPLFVVADGMGGHEAGEVASAAVVDHLGTLLDSGATVSRENLENSLRGAVHQMAEAVGPSELGTGTTITGVVYAGAGAAESQWSVLNIGDSRVYRLAEGRLDQITVDHSIVQELLSAGAISPAEAENHPHGNVITRAVGLNEDPIPDYVTVRTSPGARWVVCSDGLTKELTDYGIQHFLETSETPADALLAMFTAALGNGGRDNISAIVFDELLDDARIAAETPGTPETSSTPETLSTPETPGAPAAHSDVSTQALVDETAIEAAAHAAADGAAVPDTATEAAHPGAS